MMKLTLFVIVWLASASALAQTAPTDEQLRAAWITCMGNYPPRAGAPTMDAGCQAIHAEMLSRGAAKDAAAQQNLQSVVKQLGK